jgi:hemerythrin-like domain-containing protein
MLPIAPLMIEHRLIERMIALIDERAERAQRKGNIEPLFVDAAVEFIRMYADRTHHGKEEDILFRDLAERAMSDRDSQVMGELVEEHELGRRLVGDLVSANESYRRGASGSLEIVIEKLQALAAFYPKHIEKEDKGFFPASMTYLSDSEKDSMLSEMWDFDRQMIHEKYRRVVEAFSTGEHRETADSDHDMEVVE